MPVLAALDECLTILVEISNYADEGLAAPDVQLQALKEIKRCCDEIDETIQGILQSIDDDDEPMPPGYHLN